MAVQQSLRLQMVQVAQPGRGFHPLLEVRLSLCIMDVQQSLRLQNNSTGGTKHEHPLLGCGLSFLVPLIKVLYADQKKESQQNPNKVVGTQAKALARYAYRLIDSLHSLISHQ